MPRGRRLLRPFFPHHIMSRGNNRRNIFVSAEDKCEYYRRIRRFRDDNRIHINHYCSMDNHVHFVITLEADSTLSRFMKQLNLSFYHLLRRERGFCGHFLQGRFKSNIIDNDPYLMQCGKYIELNPVRAGMVAQPASYPFSSYSYYAEGEPDPLVTPDAWYLELARLDEERRKRYIEFVIEKNIVNSESLRSHRYIGSADFIRKMEARLGIRNLPVKGRPRKDGREAAHSTADPKLGAEE